MNDMLDRTWMPMMGALWPLLLGPHRSGWVGVPPLTPTAEAIYYFVATLPGHLLPPPPDHPGLGVRL
jgi:hypothetical protein